MRLSVSRPLRYGAAAAAVAGLLTVAAPPAGAETVPTAPSTVRITEIGLDYVWVSFVDRATNEDGFDVQRRSPGGGFTDVGGIRDHRTGQPQATGWSYSRQVGWPSSGGYYCYRVRAWNEAGSGNSAEVCPPKADLVVGSGVSLSPNPPPSGQAFTASWTVCNDGGSPSGPFYDTAQLDGDLTSIGQVSSILPGACRARSARFSDGVLGGAHRIDVRLDVFSSVTESSETNNTKVRTWFT